MKGWEDVQFLDRVKEEALEGWKRNFWEYLHNYTPIDSRSERERAHCWQRSLFFPLKQQNALYSCPVKLRGNFKPLMKGFVLWWSTRYQIGVTEGNICFIINDLVYENSKNYSFQSIGKKKKTCVELDPEMIFV